MLLTIISLQTVLSVSSFALTFADSHPHTSDSRSGYFWQVTDFHFDSNYTVSGDPHNMCHQSSSNGTKLGPYGDYSCDSPWSLVLSAIDAMKRIESSPDFIIWTGDSVPHVPGNLYDQQEVYSIIYNVTEALISSFSNTTIIPSFGNHDPYPSNQMDPDSQNYYQSILNVSQWQRLLSSDAQQTFVSGGYFSYELSPKLKVISLNTALYYYSNNKTMHYMNGDPSGQLLWLTDELESSKLVKQNVYITAHVPPGAFEMAQVYKWFQDEYNKNYLDVIKSFSDVIVAHFYGHEHSDSFRIFEDANVMFLSPAVTPWKSSIYGVGSNNPSVRLYKYDPVTAKVLDYYQYYLNLTQANAGNASWVLEYQFSAAYNVTDLTVDSVKRAAQNILKGPSEYLKRYLVYNSVSKNTNPLCDSACLLTQQCAMLYLRYPLYDDCLKHDSTTVLPSPTTSRHHRVQVPSYMLTLLIILACLVVLLAIVIMVFVFRRGRGTTLLGRGYRRFSGNYGSTRGNSESHDEPYQTLPPTV